MKLPCKGQVDVSKVHTKEAFINTVSVCFLPSPQVRNSRGIFSAAARLPPTSKITATRQSHHDEWAVIGTENCSLVASEVWSGDSIYPKWNQSSVHGQFFLSHLLFVVKTLSYLYTHTPTRLHPPSAPFLFLCEMNRSIWAPISLNETIERLSGEIWQYVLPSFLWLAADKPAIQNNTLGQSPLLTSYFVPYHLTIQTGRGAGWVTGLEIWAAWSTSDVLPKRIDASELL